MNQTRAPGTMGRDSGGGTQNSPPLSPECLLIKQELTEDDADVSLDIFEREQVRNQLIPNWTFILTLFLSLSLPLDVKRNFLQHFRTYVDWSWQFEKWSRNSWHFRGSNANYFSFKNCSEKGHTTAWELAQLAVAVLMQSR